MKRIPRVIVALARGRSLGRGEIRGIIDYANQSGPWLFYSPTISDSLKLDTIVSKIKKNNFKPDGIIASVWNPKHVDMLYDLGIPAIAQGGTKKIMNLPYIRFNWRATGKMAAEHLISRGFTNFAFCGAMDQIWSIGRRKSFSRHILEAGFKTYLYETTFAKIHFPIPEEMLNLTQWLKSLPKPIGLMACNDVYARCIAEACLLIGIEVPNDVAILGVDNDLMDCQMTHPPLSSIAFNSEDAGYKAAKLLDEMMAGKTKMKNQEILVEPKYVVTRQSTNIFTVKDPEIAKAIRFIYENAQNPIQVADVIAATSLSRSSLFKRFSKLAGHSMHSQIRRVRTRYIIQMLLDTDIPLANLAHKLGFSTGSHMARFFKKERGMSPTQFRKKYRQK